MKKQTICLMTDFLCQKNDKLYYFLLINQILNIPHMEDEGLGWGGGTGNFPLQKSCNSEQNIKLYNATL